MPTTASAKKAIHPTAMPTVAAALRPTDSSASWASRYVARVTNLWGQGMGGGAGDGGGGLSRPRNENAPVQSVQSVPLLHHFLVMLVTPKPKVFSWQMPSLANLHVLRKRG